MMRVEVTELYDAFYDVAALLWRRFLLQGRGTGNPAQIGPRFDEIVDRLEEDLFFAACARRAYTETEVKLDYRTLRRQIRLSNLDGSPRAGPSGQYHGHGFDWGTPLDTDIENRVVAGDLVGTPRSEVRLYLSVGAAA